MLALDVPLDVQGVLIPVMDVAQVAHHHAKDVLVHALVHVLVVEVVLPLALATAALLVALPAQEHALE